MARTYENGDDGAVFEADPVTSIYRYRLWRGLPGAGRALFVMLNPSTADHLAPDPTITRCRGFAEREECSRLEVVNLFAYRSTIAEQLKTFAGDVVGPENDTQIMNALEEADLVICGWGTKVPKHLRGRIREVLSLVREAGHTPLCLGTTRAGHPKHPLYLAADTPLIPFENRAFS